MSDTEIKALIGKLRWCNTVATSEAADMLQQHLTSKQEAAEREEQLVEAMRSGIARAEAQHEATKQELSDYKQKVSDAVAEVVDRKVSFLKLRRFIIPKPDTLVQAMEEVDICAYAEIKAEYADRLRADLVDRFRAALEARGLEIREKKDD